MTTKLEYLKKCIQQGQVIGNKDWYIRSFAILILKDEVYDPEDKEQYDLITKNDGLYYLDYNEDNKLTPIKILDYKPKEPLFAFQDIITVDPTWLPTIKTKQETKIGVLIINALVLYPSLGKKVDYLNKKISFKDIETILLNKLRNKEDATDKDILVPEMVDCIDRLSFLTNLASIINIGATRKAITRPPGIEQIKKKLLEEYKNDLNNPVKVVELEQRLVAIDNEYLADDPAAKNIFSKKSKTARKKLYLMYGETKDFVPDPEFKNVVIPSLSEGVDTSPKNFAKYMNDVRGNSYSRGASTALAGYSYKILQRSLSSITVLPTPCNTTKGIVRDIDEGNYKLLTHRFVKKNGWLLVKDFDEAKKYVGQSVEIRSTMYCTAPGNQLCYACMSDNYKENQGGTVVVGANISASLLTIFLKAMHSSEKQSTTINMSDLIS